MVLVVSLVTVACDTSVQANRHSLNSAVDREQVPSVEVWQLGERLRLGGPDGPGTHTPFHEVTALLVGQRGDVFVLDRKADSKIQVFDCRGRHVRTLGRSGRGPGELVNPTGLAGWLPAAEIVVVDPGQAAYVALDTIGIERLRSPRTSPVATYPARVGVDVNGYVWEELPSQGEIIRVRLGPDLEPLDSYTLPLPNLPRNYIAARNGRIRIPVPYSPQLIYHVSKAGVLYYASNDEYTIHWMNLANSGDRGVIRGLAEPAVVTEKDIDATIAGLEWFTRQGGTLTAGTFPRHHPVLRRFWTDDENHLWVQHNQTAAADPLQFDVYDARGNLIAHVTGPSGTAAAASPIMHRGFLYLVLVDPYDIPFLVRFRILGRTEVHDPCGT
jgi:hypothetical protein